MTYLQRIHGYSRDTVTSMVNRVYGTPLKGAIMERVKRAAVTFAKNHPWVTAQLGLYAGSILLGKVSKVIAKRVKPNTILELDLDNLVLTERPITLNMFDHFNTPPVKRIHYRDVVEALELAAKDEKVLGLFCRLGNPNELSRVGIAQFQEIRVAVETFRNANKITVAYFETLFSPLRFYYLASAFEYIYCQPSSLILLTDLYSDQAFVKETLEKLDIEFEGEQREKYKNILNIFTEKKMTPEHREQIERLITQMSEEMVTTIAKGRLSTFRKLTNQENLDEQGAIALVKNWFDKAGVNGREAKELGIVNELGYRHEVIKNELPKLCKVDEKRANFLFLSAYLEKKNGNSLARPKPNPVRELTTYKRQTIAVVFATGGIILGEAPSPGFGDDPSKVSIYAENIARALRNASEDKDVKCIIFRVESGGGDAIASEIINHEIERIRREKKIKVVVSIGTVAASGGYWISMSADKILASELSIVGSIGVVFGKFYMRDFWTKKIGVTFDTVSKHKLATIQSGLHKYDEEMKAVINKIVDSVYDDFIERVSNGRNIDKNEVRQLAQGKVYLGADAKRLNLIDELGGFSRAIEVAKALIEVPQDQDIHLVEYPKPASLLKKYLTRRKPAQNSEEQDKQRALAEISSPSGFIFSIFGGDLLSRVFTILFGGSNQNIMSHVSSVMSSSKAVSTVDHSATSIIA